MVLENHANMSVEERLGDMGVEVHRGVWLSDWLNDRFRFMPGAPSIRWACARPRPTSMTQWRRERQVSGQVSSWARKGLTASCT